MLTIIPYLLLYLAKYLSQRRIRSLEHSEDIREGGIDTPKPIRELSLIEVDILKKYSLHSGSRNNYTLFFGIILVFVIMISFAFTSNQLQILLNVFQKDFIAIIVTLLLVFYITNFLLPRKDYYLDLISPVFATKGKLSFKNSRYYVRDIPLDNYEHAKSIPSEFKIGEDQYIEYSPHSNIVWSFEKTA